MIFMKMFPVMFLQSQSFAVAFACCTLSELFKIFEIPVSTMNHVFVVVLVLLSSMQAVSVLGKPVNDFVFATDQYRVQVEFEEIIC